MRKTRFHREDVELSGHFHGTPEQPLIVLVHGLCGDSHRGMKKMACNLETYELSVLRFDLSGHGESKGEIQNRTPHDSVNDTLAAIEHSREQGYFVRGIFGNSYGALIGLHAAAQTPSITRVGMSSPVWDYTPIFDTLVRRGAVDLTKWKQEGRLKQHVGRHTFELPYTFYEQLPALNGFHALRDAKARVFVTHGTEDEFSPYKFSQQASTMGAQLKTYHGANHACSEHQEEIMKDFGTFFRPLLARDSPK